jgi:hypothetical protein
MDAAPLPEIHMTANESRESDKKGNRNAGVGEGHQGHVSPSARKREEGAIFEKNDGRKCHDSARGEQGNLATT